MYMWTVHRIFAAPRASLGSKRFFRCFDRAKNGAKAKMKRVGRGRGGKKKFTLFLLTSPSSHWLFFFRCSRQGCTQMRNFEKGILRNVGVRNICSVSSETQRKRLLCRLTSCLSKLQGPVVRKPINLIQDQPKSCFMFSTFGESFFCLFSFFKIDFL